MQETCGHAIIQASLALNRVPSIYCIHAWKGRPRWPIHSGLGLPFAWRMHAASAYWTIVASGIVGALMAKNRVASDESGLGPYHSHSRSSSPIRWFGWWLASFLHITGRVSAVLHNAAVVLGNELQFPNLCNALHGAGKAFKKLRLKTQIFGGKFPERLNLHP